MNSLNATKKFIQFFLVGFLLGSLLYTGKVFASGATIGVSPQSGTYAKPFSVQVVVNGNGEKFNAAQVQIVISSNLSIQNLVTEDCNFSFLQTPSITNPSFAGLLLGKSSSQCTVYTMTLAPVQKGTGTISLSKGTVRRFGDAVNILSGMTSGTYNLTGTVQVTPQPTVAPSQGNLYSVLFTLQTAASRPVGNTVVFLKSVATKTPREEKTDQQGRVQFTNLQPGIYDALVSGYPGDHIVNLTGSNHTLELGITVEPQQNILLISLANPALLIGMVAVGILVGTGIVAGILWWRMKRKV